MVFEIGPDTPPMSAAWIDMERGRDIVPIEFEIIIHAICRHNSLVIVAQSQSMQGGVKRVT